jgi:hypothetical protein
MNQTENLGSARAMLVTNAGFSENTCQGRPPAPALQTFPQIRQPTPIFPNKQPIFT